MDVLEFLARSEWPLVVGGAGLMFRRSIHRMLDRINPTKIDVWGVKAEFDRTLEKVEALSPPEPVKGVLAAGEFADTAQIIGNATVGEPETTFDINRYPPGLRIAIAWTSLVSRMMQMHMDDTRSDHPRLKWRTSQSLQELAAELGLDASEIGAFTALEALHHQIVSAIDPPVTADDAKRFEEAVSRLRLKMVFG